MNFVVVFFILSIVNVVFSTVRSIVTIRGGKVLASLISGGYFAYYNIVMVYTVADYPLWAKCVITGVTNVIGVFIVKAVENVIDKRVEKLWLVKVTIPFEHYKEMAERLKNKNISYSATDIVATSSKNNSHVMVIDTYCSTKDETRLVRELCKEFDGHIFASECMPL